MFIELLSRDPVFYVTWVLLVMFSICLHEMAHAWAALRQGDATAAESGYLTMNPLKVMGLSSIILLGVFGIAFGAVPVRPSRMRQPWGPAITAFAGPASNALLLVGFALLSRVAGDAGDGQLGLFFAVGAEANAFLFLFNMLPLPILDGWEVYSVAIPQLRRIPSDKARQFGMIALLIILFARLHVYLWRAAATLALLLCGE